MERIPVKEWAEEDRPREKFLTKGRHTLTDSELLAILLGSGTRDETAVELARIILKRFQYDLHKLGASSAQDLMEIKGVGSAKAVTILAAMEIGKRRHAHSSVSLEKIGGSADAASIFKSLLGDLMHEEFWVAYLNRANMLIGREQISKGGMTGTVADPKIIFQSALRQKACSIILCHNHPSGNIKPSEADIRLTKNLVEAGRVLEISVLDHLIVTRESYYSFADEGKI
ncbi:MAG: DNA repair protein RadC [Bacteroidota bacterium]